MTSPLVLRDIASGGGPALKRLNYASKVPLGAVNLCSSLIATEVDGVNISADLMLTVCENLCQRGLILD